MCYYSSGWQCGTVLACICVLGITFVPYVSAKDHLRSLTPISSTGSLQMTKSAVLAIIQEEVVSALTVALFAPPGGQTQMSASSGEL